MILHIDTSDMKRVKVSLKDNGEVVESLSAENEFGSQVLLSLIKKIADIKDISAIEVETGQGSFTGLRVGVSVANALGFSLGIPVNGKVRETDLVY